MNRLFNVFLGLVLLISLGFSATWDVAGDGESCLGVESPFTTIQEAIANEVVDDGDEIIVCDKGSPYSDGTILVTKSLTIRGENPNVQLTNPSSSVFIVSASNVEIRDFDIIDSRLAISLGSENNVVDGITITNMDSFGINIQNSNGNTISNNVISQTDQAAIRLFSASNNNILSNTVSDSAAGISIAGGINPSNNLINGNTISTTSTKAITVNSGESNTVSNNIISDSGIQVSNADSTTISGNQISSAFSHSIFSQNSDSLNIINNEISNSNSQAIYINNPEITPFSSNIEGNTLTSQTYGIYYFGLFENTLTIDDNTITDSSAKAIDVQGKSTIESFSGNVIDGASSGLSLQSGASSATFTSDNTFNNLLGNEVDLVGNSDPALDNLFDTNGFKVITDNIEFGATLIEDAGLESYNTDTQTIDSLTLESDGSNVEFTSAEFVRTSSTESFGLEIERNMNYVSSVIIIIYYDGSESTENLSFAFSADGQNWVIYDSTIDSETNSVTADLGNIGSGYVALITHTNDQTPPASVSDLQNVGQTNTTLDWSWTNPSDDDFAYAQIYLDGVNVENTTNSYYNATGLAPETSYTLTIHTVDNSGNVNTTDVTNTASTTASGDSGDDGDSGGDPPVISDDSDDDGDSKQDLSVSRNYICSTSTLEVTVTSEGDEESGVDVQIVNQDTGGSESDSTNSDGFVSFSGLEDGTYKLIASGDDYFTETKNNIKVESCEAELDLDDQDSDDIGSLDPNSDSNQTDGGPGSCVEDTDCDEGYICSVDGTCVEDDDTSLIEDAQDAINKAQEEIDNAAANGKDVSDAVKKLNEAKEAFANEEYLDAKTLADQSIGLIKDYDVQIGDSTQNSDEVEQSEFDYVQICIPLIAILLILLLLYLLFFRKGKKEEKK